MAVAPWATLLLLSTLQAGASGQSTSGSHHGLYQDIGLNGLGDARKNVSPLPDYLLWRDPKMNDGISKKIYIAPETGSVLGISSLPSTKAEGVGSGGIGWQGLNLDGPAAAPPANLSVEDETGNQGPGAESQQIVVVPPTTTTTTTTTSTTTTTTTLKTNSPTASPTLSPTPRPTTASPTGSPTTPKPSTSQPTTSSPTEISTLPPSTADFGTFSVTELNPQPDNNQDDGGNTVMGDLQDPDDVVTNSAAMMPPPTKKQEQQEESPLPPPQEAQAQASNQAMMRPPLAKEDQAIRAPVAQKKEEKPVASAAAMTVEQHQQASQPMNDHQDPEEEDRQDDMAVDHLVLEHVRDSPTPPSRPEPDLSVNMMTSTQTLPPPPQAEAMVVAQVEEEDDEEEEMVEVKDTAAGPMPQEQDETPAIIGTTATIPPPAGTTTNDEVGEEDEQKHVPLGTMNHDGNDDVPITSIQMRELGLVGLEFHPTRPNTFDRDFTQYVIQRALPRYLLSYYRDVMTDGSDGGGGGGDDASSSGMVRHVDLHVETVRYMPPATTTVSPPSTQTVNEEEEENDAEEDGVPDAQQSVTPSGTDGVRQRLLRGERQGRQLRVRHDEVDEDIVDSAIQRRDQQVNPLPPAALMGLDDQVDDTQTETTLPPGVGRSSGAVGGGGAVGGRTRITFQGSVTSLLHHVPTARAQEEGDEGTVNGEQQVSSDMNTREGHNDDRRRILRGSSNERRGGRQRYLQSDTTLAPEVDPPMTIDWEAGVDFITDALRNSSILEGFLTYLRDESERNDTTTAEEEEGEAARFADKLVGLEGMTYLPTSDAEAELAFVTEEVAESIIGTPNAGGVATRRPDDLASAQAENASSSSGDGSKKAGAAVGAVIAMLLVFGSAFFVYRQRFQRTRAWQREHARSKAEESRRGSSSSSLSYGDESYDPMDDEEEDEEAGDDMEGGRSTPRSVGPGHMLMSPSMRFLRGLVPRRVGRSKQGNNERDGGSSGDEGTSGLDGSSNTDGEDDGGDNVRKAPTSSSFRWRNAGASSAVVDPKINPRTRQTCRARPRKKKAKSSRMNFFGRNGHPSMRIRKGSPPVVAAAGGGSSSGGSSTGGAKSSTSSDGEGDESWLLDTIREGDNESVSVATSESIDEKDRTPVKSVASVLPPTAEEYETTSTDEEDEEEEHDDDMGYDDDEEEAEDRAMEDQSQGENDDVAAPCLTDGAPDDGTDVDTDTSEDGSGQSREKDQTSQGEREADDDGDENGSPLPPEMVAWSESKRFEPKDDVDSGVTASRDSRDPINGPSRHSNEEADAVATNGEHRLSPIQVERDEESLGGSLYETITIDVPKGKLDIGIDQPIEGAPHEDLEELCVVSSVKDDSPVVGQLLEGDFILKVDDEDARGWDSTTISDYLASGLVRTDRRITVRRGSAPAEEMTNSDEVGKSSPSVPATETMYTEALFGDGGKSRVEKLVSLMDAVAGKHGEIGTLSTEDEIVVQSVLDMNTFVNTNDISIPPTKQSSLTRLRLSKSVESCDKTAESTLSGSSGLMWRSGGSADFDDQTHDSSIDSSTPLIVDAID